MNRRIARKIMRRCEWPYEENCFVCHSKQDVQLLFKALQALRLRWTVVSEIMLRTENSPFIKK